jgi:hypothetical protein
MMQGTWRVTYYSDHGQEETDHFTGYDFTFGADDLLSATDGSNTYTGAWTLSTNKTEDETPAIRSISTSFLRHPPILKTSAMTGMLYRARPTRLSCRM